MKYIIKKSKFVILFSFIISICILLLAASFVSSFQNINKSFNYLSDNYCEISVSSNQNNNLSINKFINKLSKYGSDFTILKGSDTKVYGVYSDSSNFSPNIVEGRNLNESDFESNCNSIIINETLKDKCYFENNEMFYIFNSTVYRVVGVFEEDNNIKGNALAYYNLLNTQGKDDNYIVGNFYVDFGKNTESILDALSDDVNIDIVRQNNKTSLSEKLILLISSQQTTLSSFILIIIMAFLNSIGMIVNWIDSRKDEIKSKFVCGALKSEIILEFVLQFYAITIISFIFVCALIIPLLCVFKSVTIAMLSMVSSLVFVLLLSVISVIILSLVINNEFPKREEQRI